MVPQTALLQRPAGFAGSKVAAIFYDVGGTLLDTSPTVDEFADRVAAAMGVPVDRARLKAAFPDLYGFITAHEAVRGGKGSAWRSDAGIRQLWVDFYVHSFQKAGIDAPQHRMRDVAQQAYNWYMDPNAWRPFPDVVPALEAGRRLGLAQGVISDWGSELIDILNELRLTDYLDFVVSSAVVGWAKPHPEIFLHALARAGVHPYEAVYVGDFYVNDILGARSVGINPVLIDRDGTAPPVDCPVITTLVELPGTIGIAA